MEAGSAEAVGAALRVVAPELGDCPVVVREPIGADDPLWQSASAVVDGRFVVKFAWSRLAGLRLAHEIAVLGALAPAVPFLPEVVASSTDPLLLVKKL